MERTDIESGTVLATEGTYATVVINKSKSCKECGKARAGICGKSGAGMVMKVKNSIHAVKGDDVTLGMGMRTQIKGYIIFFILPVAALMIGAYAGHLISRAIGINNLDAIAGISFLSLSLARAYFSFRKLSNEAQLSITGILHATSDSLAYSYPEEMDYLNAYNGRHNP